IGAAQACLRQVLDYTATRTLFGRPLAANQTIQVRLADMARRITTAQLLALQLGRLKDAGVMHPAHVSLAKWNNCRMALDVARASAPGSSRVADSCRRTFDSAADRELSDSNSIGAEHG